MIKNLKNRQPYPIDFDKLNVGDHVRVKPWAHIKDTASMDKGRYITFLLEMREYCGHEYKIAGISSIERYLVRLADLKDKLLPDIFHTDWLEIV